METPELAAQRQKEETEDDASLQYECEQALLRMRFGQPSVDEAWRRLETRVRNRVAVERRRRLHRRMAGAVCVGVAAVAVVFCLFQVPEQSDAPECDHIVLCETCPETAVVISACPAIDTEASRATVTTGESPVERWGAVISKQQADYTQAESDRVHTCVVTIPRGQVYRLVLSDSTHVWMNADSRLSFPSRFTGATREVWLEGEAYFRVAKDAAHPFIIHTHNATAEVLGTEFNVNAYPNADACVTLVEGSVKVEMHAIGREVVLSPGQDVVCGDSTFEVRKANIRYSGQWKDGVLYFDNTYLVNILHELGRRYNLTVEIEDDPKLMYTCLHLVVDRDETIDNIVENLNMFEYLLVTKNGEKITIRRK